MNQQSQKLYSQSMTAHRIENRPDDVFTKSFSAELDANKFAELIVQECIRECKQELYEFTAEDKSYDDLKATAIRAGHRNGVFKVISRIKQHFGVEE